MKTSLSQQPWRAFSEAAVRAGAGAMVAASLVLASGHAIAQTTVTTLTGGPNTIPGPYYGYVDGQTKEKAQFHTPIGLALNTAGNLLYVADRDNNAVRVVNVNPAADVTYTFTTDQINQPVGVVVDSGDNVYVLNRGNGNNGSILVFDSFADPLGTVATNLVSANGLALDSFDNLYVTVSNNTVVKITVPMATQSTVTTISNANTVLQGVAVDSSGFLAVCDSGLAGIWRIDPTTGNATTNTGFNGIGDHFGPRKFAKFVEPFGVTAVGNGMLVVSDRATNRVKVVDAQGTVTNLYGVDEGFWVTGPGTYPGWWDGPVGAGDANYNTFGFVESRLPSAVLFDNTDGSVYTAEDFYHLIRQVKGANLPKLPAAPPPPTPPAVGWVFFTPPSNPLSILETNAPFIFNNDVVIAIEGTPGTEAHYTSGPTPQNGAIDTIPVPSAFVGSTPPFYQDGMYPYQVPPSLVPPQPDVTVKAVSLAGSESSPVVSARFQFKTANPAIAGDNAALFTVTDQTTNAAMYYTIDGSDPSNVGTNSLGPITSGVNLSLSVVGSNLTFKIRAFRNNYQHSDIVTKLFSANAFVPNSITFGFSSGEASSAFVGSPGQRFYAPVTLSPTPGTLIDSLQFNVTVTNGGPNPGPAVAPGAYSFQSMLVQPIPGTQNEYTRIPPAMFITSLTNPAPVIPNNTFPYNGGWYERLVFTNSSQNLLGVGWLERQGQTNLYNTLSQDLIQYSMAHDTVFSPSSGKVILGGYAFQIPTNAANGQTYQIQLGRPSATTDGIGDPGSAVVISAPTNGSLTVGAPNALKNVTVGQLSYLAGDSAPFRWFNAGDYGDGVLDNSDVMQVFQSAIYSFNFPPPGSDFFDSMDSCGALGTPSVNGYLVPGLLLTGAQKDGLFDGNDTLIDQIAFGDGILDVCDVYVTFRRSLDPTRTLYQRFWTNGVLGAQVAPATPAPAPPSILARKTASVNFASSDIRASAGQTVQIPVTAAVFGNYPLRVLMLGLSVVPLDGSPALTVPVQFTPSAALGSPTIVSSAGNGNYAATWLNSTISGLTGNAVLGTLTVRVPASAGAMAAYAIHFDHASASPNGLASFAKQTTTGLILLSDRSSSIYNDGIPDSWRLRYFGTVYNILSQASADADGDGMNNWQEYVAGTDPTDPASNLRSSTTRTGALSAQDCVIHWPSVSGKQYIIQRSPILFGGAWTSISTNIGTGGTMEFHDTSGGNTRYYRVQVVGP